MQGTHTSFSCHLPKEPHLAGAHQTQGLGGQSCAGVLRSCGGCAHVLLSD